MAVDAPDHALGRRPVATAIAGAGVIAFSAIIVRLAGVHPETAAVFRCGYAIPALWLLARSERRRYGPRPVRDRRLGLLAGALFAADLITWHHAIADVGAGLGTVLGNLQVVLVALLAWPLLGERPPARTAVAVPVVVLGAVLISGVFEQGAFGDDPVRGTLFGIGTTVAYAGFILVLRRTNADIRRPAGPLLDATAAAAVISGAVGASYGAVDLVPLVAGARLAGAPGAVEPGRRLAADLHEPAAAAGRPHEPPAADPAGGERRTRSRHPRRGAQRAADRRGRGHPCRRGLRHERAAGAVMIRRRPARGPRADGAAAPDRRQYLAQPRTDPDGVTTISCCFAGRPSMSEFQFVLVLS